jgi:cysteine synthase
MLLPQVTVTDQPAANTGLAINAIAKTMRMSFFMIVPPFVSIEHGA